jgi:hypothetical protein
VFELTTMCGHRTEKILHRFGYGSDGYSPVANVIFDTAGNLYGTTALGGAYSDSGGMVFEIIP